MSKTMEAAIIRAARQWWKRTNPPIVGAGPRHVEALWGAVGELVEKEAKQAAKERATNEPS